MMKFGFLHFIIICRKSRITMKDEQEQSYHIVLKINVHVYFCKQS